MKITKEEKMEAAKNVFDGRADMAEKTSPRSKKPPEETKQLTRWTAPLLPEMRPSPVWAAWTTYPVSPGVHFTSQPCVSRRTGK